MRRPMASVIVPTFREGNLPERNLVPLRDDPQVEVIIADAEVIGRANRAFQMNWGASRARGEILVFLHADTRIALPDLMALCQILREKRRYVGGAFRFALDARHVRAKIIEYGVLLRELVFGLPYGDQAIFVRRKFFEQIGGYPDVPLLEDVLLIQRMKDNGPLLYYSKKATTSAQRWERHGYLKTTLVNWGAMLLWKLGVAPGTLQRFREGALS